jgi:DNA-damage-inducible protein D
VIQKARTACFNSGHRIEDHFVGADEMIEIGKGGQRAIPTVYLSRYACYLIIQNADPRKEIIALGQTRPAIPLSVKRCQKYECWHEMATVTM